MIALRNHILNLFMKFLQYSLFLWQTACFIYLMDKSTRFWICKIWAWDHYGAVQVIKINKKWNKSDDVKCSMQLSSFRMLARNYSSCTYAKQFVEASLLWFGNYSSISFVFSYMFVENMNSLTTGVTVTKIKLRICIVVQYWSQNLVSKVRFSKEKLKMSPSRLITRSFKNLVAQHLPLFYTVLYVEILTHSVNRKQNKII